MIAELPKKVILTEVGPRDGFQFEKEIIPTTLKVKIIEGLAASGIRHIQVTSFVHPKRVPQMADAEKLLRILPRVKGIHYHGLVLNPKGLSRAMLAGLDFVEISSSASNTHSLQNTGMPRRKAFNRARDMVILAQKNNLRVRAGIQCAFGYLSTADIPPSRVFKMVQDYTALGVDMLILADTTGMATPLSISRMLRRMHPFSVPVGLHLHDTRGLGPVNVMAGLKAGVVRFDTALGGMGGCPFIPGAAGNISTEDTLHLLHAHNMETGVDIAAVAACSRTLEKYFGKRFSGKVHRLT